MSTFMMMSWMHRVHVMSVLGPCHDLIVTLLWLIDMRMPLRSPNIFKDASQVSQHLQICLSGLPNIFKYASQVSQHLQRCLSGQGWSHQITSDHINSSHVSRIITSDTFSGHMTPLYRHWETYEIDLDVITNQKIFIISHVWITKNINFF